MFVETFRTDVVFIGKVIMHLTSYGPIIFRMKVKVNNSLLVAKCATAKNFMHIQDENKFNKYTKNKF